MKRVLFLVFLILGLFSISAYAASPTPAATATPNNNAVIQQEKDAKKLLEDIKANNKSLLELKNTIIGQQTVVKKKIEDMFKDKDKLTIEQLENIKEMVGLIKDDSSKIDQIQTYYKVGIADIVRAKEKKDLASLIKNMQGVISIQKKGIEQLRKINNDLIKISKL